MSFGTLNALTIDVEEWFCVHNFGSVIPRDDWPRLESRIERQMHTILDLLDSHSVKATFFILGWIAERHPRLVREVAERGHEIASHGHEHKLAYDQSPAEFRDDLRRSLETIGEASGARCQGYRAPSFSLRGGMREAWETLCESGIRYDSSIFPVSHDRYGDPDAPRFPYTIESGGSTIVEYPLSTVRAFGRNLPVAGGGYFRLYPLAFTRWSVKRINRAGHGAVVYLHPWEFDPDHPTPRASRLKILRHRVGLRSVTHKLSRLLEEFRFAPMRSVLGLAEPEDRTAGTRRTESISRAR